jgi:hypothetical protein
MPAHVTPLYIIIIIVWWTIQTTKLSIIQFYPCSCFVCPVTSTKSPLPNFLYHFHMCSSLQLRNQISHSYDTAGNITLRIALSSGKHLSRGLHTRSPEEMKKSNSLGVLLLSAPWKYWTSPQTDQSQVKSEPFTISIFMFAFQRPKTWCNEFGSS